MYIGIDIGGTTTRMALFNSLNTSGFEDIGTFATHQTYEDQLKSICQRIEGIESAKLQGIGISIGAQVAKDGSHVFASSNLPNYVGKPIVQTLSDKYTCPVRIAHDCVCGLLAEKRFGDISDVDRVAYLTISTGTGGAVQLKQGNSEITFSNEMGHQIIDPNGYQCLCGQIGCLETITGGSHIRLRFGREASEITDRDFWEEFTNALALGIVNLSWLTRVDAVTISGGIALNNEYLRENLQATVDRLWTGEEGQRFYVFWSKLGAHSPLVGAAILLDTDPKSILH